MTDKKIGVIAPGGACGHFIYAMHSKNNFSISNNGDAHWQTSNYGFDEGETVHDRFQNNFIAHWQDDKTARNLYPNHLLISIQPEPYNVLLIAYLMTIKATIPSWNLAKHEKYFNNRTVDFRKSFFDYSLSEQYEIFSLSVRKVSEYQYCGAADIQYKIDNIFFEPTNNKKLLEYRKNNQKHIVDCLDFVKRYSGITTDSAIYTKIYYKLFVKNHKFLDT